MVDIFVGSHHPLPEKHEVTQLNPEFFDQDFYRLFEINKTRIEKEISHLIFTEEIFDEAQYLLENIGVKADMNFQNMEKRERIGILAKKAVLWLQTKN